MKKLMMVACAVAISAVSQAANVNWGSSEITTSGLDAGLTIGNNVSMYIWEFSEDDWGSTGYTTAGNIWKDYSDGKLTTSDANFYSATYDKGAMSAITSGKTTWGEEAVYAAVLFQYEKSGKTAYYMENWSGEDATDFGTDVADLGQYLGGDGSYGVGEGAISWTKVGGDVPEPTSGLLLLLGMAGLALRRRA